MDTLIINESLSQDLIIPDDNTVTIPIQIEKNGKQYFPVFDESIGGRNLISNLAQNWEQGSYDGGNLGDILYSVRIRVSSEIAVESDREYVLSIPSEYEVWIPELNASKVGITRTYAEFWSSRVFKTGIETKYIKVTVRKKGVSYTSTNPDDFIFPADINNIHIKLEKGNKATPWTPAPEDLLELSIITSNFCKVTKDNNNIILSDFSADQGYIEFEVPYGDDWTINHRVNITRDIKFRPLAFDNRLLKFQDRLLHIRETPHIMYSELMDYAYSNNIETPPTSNLRALNYLYKNLESEGLDMFDLLYNFAYIDTAEQFKLLNLWNNRDYDATAYGGLMWSNEGVKGNGVNGYIDTNFNPSLLVEGQKYQLNDVGVGIGVVQDGSLNAQRRLVGSRDNRIELNNYPSTRQLINTSKTLINLTGLTGQGEKYGIRNKTNEIQIVNTVDSSFSASDSEMLPNIIYILRSFASYADLKINNVLIGASITYEQTQIFRQIFNQYLTSIGLDPIA